MFDSIYHMIISTLKSCFWHENTKILQCIGDIVKGVLT